MPKLFQQNDGGKGYRSLIKRHWTLLKDKIIGSYLRKTTLVLQIKLY